MVSSDLTHAPSPAPVHFATGVTLQKFSIMTQPVTSSTSVTFSVTYNGVGRQFTVTLEPPQAFFTNLIPPLDPTNPHYSNRGNAINNSGQVVGTAASLLWSAYSSYQWNPAVMVELPRLDSSGQSTSEAFAINNAGVVVGSEGNWPFRWNGTTIVNLDPTDGGAALAVNAAGKVAGFANTVSGQRAFMHDGTLHLLGTLGGSYSQASGINSSDVVIGWANTADGHQHAFRWTQSGGMQDLGLPAGSTDAVANAINTAGTVVGYANVSGVQRACKWSGGTSSYLDVSGPGVATAINDLNQIVGVSNYHPMLWDGATRTQLDALPGACGWESSVIPTGINNHGQIIGNDDSEEGELAWLLDVGRAAGGRGDAARSAGGGADLAGRLGLRIQSGAWRRGPALRAARDGTGDARAAGCQWSPRGVARPGDGWHGAVRAAGGDAHGCPRHVLRAAQPGRSHARRAGRTGALGA